MSFSPWHGFNAREAEAFGVALAPFSFSDIAFLTMRQTDPTKQPYKCDCGEILTPGPMELKCDTCGYSRHSVLIEDLTPPPGLNFHRPRWLGAGIFNTQSITPFELLREMSKPGRCNQPHFFLIMSNTGHKQRRLPWAKENAATCPYGTLYELFDTDRAGKQAIYKFSTWPTLHYIAGNWHPEYDEAPMLRQMIDRRVTNTALYDAIMEVKNPDRGSVGTDRLMVAEARRRLLYNGNNTKFQFMGYGLALNYKMLTPRLLREAMTGPGGFGANGIMPKFVKFGAPFSIPTMFPWFYEPGVNLKPRPHSPRIVEQEGHETRFDFLEVMSYLERHTNDAEAEKKGRDFMLFEVASQRAYQLIQDAARYRAGLPVEELAGTGAPNPLTV